MEPPPTAFTGGSPPILIGSKSGCGRLVTCYDGIKTPYSCENAKDEKFPHFLLVEQLGSTARITPLR